VGGRAARSYRGAVTAPGPAPASPFSHRIAGFLAAEALSAIGSWATVVAIWGYAAFEFGASATEVSLFGLAFSLPSVVFAPVAGALIDRVGPKATLAAAKALGVAASLALLAADDFGSLTVLSILHGTAMAFSYPALQSLPPRLVADEHLARTNALVSLTDELAIVLGPVAAGVAIVLFGFDGAFVFDALTYGLGLVVLPVVRLQPVRAEAGDAEPEGVGRLREAMEGWRLIVRSVVLRRVVGCTFAVHLLYGAALLCEPLYVRDVLEQPWGVFAALQSVFGVCLVLTGLLVARAGEHLASFRWVALGVGASGLTAVVYLGTPWVPVAFVGVALWGVATAGISGPSRTVMQRSSPQRAHGRVLSADYLAGSLGEVLAVSTMGVVVDAFGVRSSIVGLGLAVAAFATRLLVADRRDGASATPPTALAEAGAA
jgi:predicted MFS family arabinose efflux permease